MSRIAVDQIWARKVPQDDEWDLVRVCNIHAYPGENVWWTVTPHPEFGPAVDTDADILLAEYELSEDVPDELD